MSKITVKSTKSVIFAAYEDAIRELELVKRQLADAMTEKGVLLSQNAILRDEVAASHEEMQKLEGAVNSYAHRCDALEELLAKPKSPAPKPKVPAPKPSAPATPVASPQAQEAMAMFLKLTPQQRSAVIKHSGFKVVNLGNILECQAKWHSRKSA